MDSDQEKGQILQRVGENLYRSDSSGRYYALFKRDGKQIRRSLKTKDKELARRRLANFRGQVQRLASADAKTLPFTEYNQNNELVGGLAKRWLDTAAVHLKAASKDRRLRAINSLSPHFKDKIVANVHRLDLERWAAKRSEELAARTFNMELETIRLCFNYAVEHGMILDNPAVNIRRRKLSKIRLSIPNRQQFKDLLSIMHHCRTLTKQCSEDEAAPNLVEFLAYSGCRLAEVVGDIHFDKEPMKWGDADFELKTFTVTGKGADVGKTRTVPLFQPLERLLLDLLAKLQTKPLPSDPIFKIQSAKKAIATACRRLGLPTYTHHTFRHFFASNAIELGIDFKVIAEWLGHSDGGVLVARTYGHLRAEHSVRMAKRMTFDATAMEVPNLISIHAMNP